MFSRAVLASWARLRYSSASVEGTFDTVLSTYLHRHRWYADLVKGMPYDSVKGDRHARSKARRVQWYVHPAIQYNSMGILTLTDAGHDDDGDDYCNLLLDPY